MLKESLQMYTKQMNLSIFQRNNRTTSNGKKLTQVIFKYFWTVYTQAEHKNLYLFTIY